MLEIFRFVKTAEDDQFYNIAASELFPKRKIVSLFVCYTCTTFNYAEPAFFEKSYRFDGIILTSHGIIGSEDDVYGLNPDVLGEMKSFFFFAHNNLQYL